MCQSRALDRCSVAMLLGLGLLLGCQETPTLAPEAASGKDSRAPGATYDLISGEESLVALYELVVDLTAGTATSTPIPGRTAVAQPPQAQQYDLDIANFLTPQGFAIEGITVLPSGDVRVQFRHAHPFPAPNPANPITGLNRADLGYTGRCVILATGSPQSFFGGTVTVSPTTVLDADGYLNPGDLIAGLGLSPVNVFPYMLLADEARNNRVEVSNNDIPTGSYDAPNGGWQLANLGSNSIGWTGFDFVHGGQTIANEFTLSKESLAGGFFRADVAILIKYTDPRGQGGASRRLPPAPADPLAFAYRLPYSALDMSVIESEVSPLEIGEASGSQVGARFFVRDWDAIAIEAGDATLGDETSVALIQPGAAGKGLLSLDCPALSDTPATSGGSPGTPSGHPGDELAYRPSLTNALGTATGRVYALARIVDPEFNDPDRDNYAFGVDPVSLIPSAARAVAPITYQILPVDVGTPVMDGPPEITGVSPEGILGAANSFVQFTATATGNPFLYAWNFGAGISPSTAFGNDLSVRLATPGMHTGTVVAVNSFGSSQPTSFSYEVLGPPTILSMTSDPPVLLPDMQAQFSAATEGIVDIYDWEFPAGFSVRTANDQEPVNFVPSTPGQYFVTLRVSNSAGASDPFEFPFVVEREPSTGWSRIALRSDFGTPDNPSIILGSTGFPVVAYAVNGATSQVRVAQALEAYPTNPADWTDHAVAAVTGEQITTPKLTLRGTSLLLGYVTDTRLRFANASTDNPATATDWTKSTVLTHAGSFELLEMQQINDAVQWLAWDVPMPLQGVMRFGRALVLNPDEESDWQHYPFTIDATQFIRPVMCASNGLPTIAVADQTLGMMRLGLPIVLPATEEADWEFTDIAFGPFFSLSLRPYQGDLVLGYANPNDLFRPYLAQSVVSFPEGTADWLHQRVSSGTKGVTRTDLSTDGSRVILASQDGLVGDLVLSYASLPEGESDWTTVWVSTFGNQGTYFDLPPTTDGIYIVYPDAATNELVLAYPTP